MDSRYIETQSSPIIAKRESNLITFGNVYDDKSELGDSIVNREFSSKKIAVTENPLRNLMTTHSSATIDDSDDASLRADYHTQCMQTDGYNGDMYAFNDEILSFEEWKLKRKEFKNGTRGSFIKAFEVFQEREQLSSTDSAKHISQLHHSSSSRKPF